MYEVGRWYENECSPEWRMLEEVECFKYLVSHVVVNGVIEGEVKFRKE